MLLSLSNELLERVMCCLDSHEVYPILFVNKRLSTIALGRPLHRTLVIGQNSPRGRLESIVVHLTSSANTQTQHIESLVYRKPTATKLSRWTEDAAYLVSTIQICRSLRVLDLESLPSHPRQSLFRSACRLPKLQVLHLLGRGDEPWTLTMAEIELIRPNHALLNSCIFDYLGAEVHLEKRADFSGYSFTVIQGDLDLLEALDLTQLLQCALQPITRLVLECSRIPSRAFIQALSPYAADIDSLELSYAFSNAADCASRFGEM